MDTSELKFTKLENEIFTLLSLRAGEKFSQREVASVLNVSPTAVSKSIPTLLRLQLLIQEKTNVTHFISFNNQNKRAIQLKRVQNQKMLYVTGFVDLLEEVFAGSTIILFGSFSRGEDSKHSDIDLAIIGRKFKHIDLIKFEKIFSRPINVNFYDSWENIHKHLRNNILNGIVLHGSIEL